MGIAVVSDTRQFAAADEVCVYTHYSSKTEICWKLSNAYGAMDMTKDAAPHGVSTVQPVVMASHTIICETQRTLAARSDESDASPCAEFPDCQRGDNENSGSNENIDVWPQESHFECIQDTVPTKFRMTSYL